MKQTLALAGMTLAVCALAGAQDTGNRVVVPGRNGSHARMLEASVISGEIIVKTGSGNDVIVEVNGDKTPPRPSANTPPGMHRIDIPFNAPLRVEEGPDAIHVSLTPRAGGDTLTITVPANISLKLNATHGDVKVDGVRGEIDAASTHGDITLTNVSGTVVANTMHGSLKVSMNQVDQSKPLSFTTMSGEIDVTLPADVKANVKLRALRGEIWSDFDVKLTGSAPITRGTSGGGRLIMIDRTMNGTINGGGVDATFYTVNGKIMIHKK
ncbi:MAG TPA: DUF4097 family beta strand repeat-containing protein [Candidatus Sulfopaludibacter sp.]|jgi:hypothetical protein|nr:DUF4097 family beta strand repeat-containing protein [Candidatus Sulfopaludibacter sp.]